MDHDILDTFVGAIFLGILAQVLAERQAPQSGILASVVMGLTVSSANTPNLSQVNPPEL